MFKRVTLAMVMLGTLAVGSFGFTSTADAQRFRGGWYVGRPYYGYYAPPTYRYYYGPSYRWYGAPYTYYYYDAPYAPYYTARPGFQVYFR